MKMVLTRNKFSLLGIFIGALSIMALFISQSLEREHQQTKPKLEQVVHNKISALKKATIDAIKGKSYVAPAENEELDTLHDKIEQSKLASLILGVCAIVAAGIAFIRREQKYASRIALLMGGSVIIAELLLGAMLGIASIIGALLFLWMIASFIGGIDIC